MWKIAPNPPNLLHEAPIVHHLNQEFIGDLAQCNQHDRLTLWVVVAFQILIDIFDVYGGSNMESLFDGLQSSVYTYRMIVDKILKHHKSTTF